jgi:hypothetical protein
MKKQVRKIITVIKPAMFLVMTFVSVNFGIIRQGID